MTTLTKKPKQAAAERKRAKAADIQPARHPTLVPEKPAKPKLNVTPTPPPTWTKSTYKTGDGDTFYPMRAGSCHKHLKSLMT